MARLYPRLVLLCVWVLLAASCQGSPSVRPLPDNAIRLQDDLGRAVLIEPPVRRVVAFSPGAVRLMEGVGAGDLVVAVGPRVRREALGERLSGVSAVAILERLDAAVDVEADLVLAGRVDYEDWVRASDGAIPVPILVFDPQDLEGVMDDVELVGLAVDHGAEARAAVAGMRQRLERVAAALEGAETVRAYWDWGTWSEERRGIPVPPWVGRLTSLAGGRRVAEEATDLADPAIAEADPEVILQPRGLVGGSAKELLLQARPEEFSPPRGAELTFQGARVYSVPADLVLVPGPQLALGVEVLAHLFHPGRIPAPEE